MKRSEELEKDKMGNEAYWLKQIAIGIAQLVEQGEHDVNEVFTAVQELKEIQAFNSGKESSNEAIVEEINL